MICLTAAEGTTISVEELNVMLEEAIVLSRHNCLSIGVRCISQRTVALLPEHCLTTPVSSILKHQAISIPKIVSFKDNTRV